MLGAHLGSASASNSSVPGPYVGWAAIAFEQAGLAARVGFVRDGLAAGRWDQAITELSRLRQTAFERCDAELAEVVCQNLAVAYRQVGKLSSASSWQQQSIAWRNRRAAIDRGCEDDELARLACDLTGRGCDEFLRRKWDIAESFWRRALAIEEWRGSKEGQAIDCGNLGLLAAARNELSEGIRWLRKSLRLHRLMLDDCGVGTDMMNLAELLRLQREFRRSTSLLRRAVRCFERTGAEALRQQAALRLQEATRIEGVLQLDPRLN